MHVFVLVVATEINNVFITVRKKKKKKAQTAVNQMFQRYFQLIRTVLWSGHGCPINKNNHIYINKLCQNHVSTSHVPSGISLLGDMFHIF